MPKGLRDAPRPQRQGRDAPRDFQGRLKQILSRELTPENLENYFEQAINDLGLLANDAQKEYRRLHPETPPPKTITLNKESKVLTGSLEDVAFREFKLQEIPDTLDIIGRKQGSLNTALKKVNEWLKKARERIPAVVVPAAEKAPPVGSGTGKFERPDTFKRYAALLFILADSGYKEGDWKSADGVLTSGMMRKTTYIVTQIAKLNRVVLTCDEGGNSTYVFDQEKLSEKVPSINIYSLKKPELDGIVAEYPGIGLHLNYSSRWISRMRTLLFEDIPAVQSKNDNLQDEFSDDIPSVSRIELDPWYGFIAKGNEHIGTTDAIAHKINAGLPTSEPNIDSTIIRRFATSRALMPEKIHSLKRQQGMGYCYETVEEIFKKFISLPTAEKEGEWKGFHHDQQNNLHIGSEQLIQKRLSQKGYKISKALIRHAITTLNLVISPTSIRLGYREVKKPYPYEPIEAEINRYFAIPRVALESPNEGFYEHEGSLYGTIFQAEKRLDIQAGYLRKLEHRLMRWIPVRDLSNRETRGYSLEECRKLWEEHKNSKAASNPDT